MKNSNDTIRNLTRDLPSCRAVPQPTAPPRDKRWVVDEFQVIWQEVVVHYRTRTEENYEKSIMIAGFRVEIQNRHHTKIQISRVTATVARSNMHCKTSPTAQYKMKL